MAFRAGGGYKNRCGGTISIPRKGCNARRSASPVTTCDAWPLTASSRNLSSFGSRQAVIRTSTSTHSASRVKAAKSFECPPHRCIEGIFSARGLHRVRRASQRTAELFLFGGPVQAHDEASNLAGAKH